MATAAAAAAAPRAATAAALSYSLGAKGGREREERGQCDAERRHRTARATQSETSNTATRGGEDARGAPPPYCAARGLHGAILPQAWPSPPHTGSPRKYEATTNSTSLYVRPLLRHTSYIFEDHAAATHAYTSSDLQWVRLVPLGEASRVACCVHASPHPMLLTTWYQPVRI